MVVTGGIVWRSVRVLCGRCLRLPGGWVEEDCAEATPAPMRMTMPNAAPACNTRREPAPHALRLGFEFVGIGRHRHLLFLPETRAPAVGFKKDGYFGKLPTPALSGSGSRVSSQPRHAEHPCFNNLIETLPAWHLQIELADLPPESRRQGTIGFERRHSQPGDFRGVVGAPQADCFARVRHCKRQTIVRKFGIRFMRSRPISAPCGALARR